MNKPSRKPLPLGLRAGEWSDVLSPKVLGQFVGKHIAIVHKSVIAAGDTYEAVVSEAIRLYPNETPYIAYIPINDSESTISSYDVEQPD